MVDFTESNREFCKDCQFYYIVDKPYERHGGIITHLCSISDGYGGYPESHDDAANECKKRDRLAAKCCVVWIYVENFGDEVHVVCDKPKGHEGRHEGNFQENGARLSW